MAQINAEFGRGNNLNSYRGTTYYTSGGGPFTFPSGAISFSNFYGTTPTSPSFSFTISAHQDQANLRTLALNAGWNGSSVVTATLAAGYWIYSSNAGVPALTIDGSWPGGVTFINNGYVVGMGGAGGAGGAYNTTTNGVTGSSGGTALSVSSPVTIQNNGIFAGGGGGGGGGGGSGSSYGPADNGGGGGGGQTGLANSSGGAAGAAAARVANAGGSGTSGGAGGGGAGSFFDAATGGGSGGNGGGWGATGAAGAAARGGAGVVVLGTGAPGGGGGLCTSGGSNITYTATGTRYGGLG